MFSHMSREQLYTLTDIYLFIFYYRGICIIDNGASRRRTRDSSFRGRRADAAACLILCFVTSISGWFDILY